MRSILPAFVLCPCLLHADPVEIASERTALDPFGGKALDTFLAGSPPSFAGGHNTNLGAVSGRQTYWFGEDRGFGIMMSPSFASVVWNGAEPLAQIQPQFSPAEGVYVLRDKEGRVAQAWSDVLVVIYDYTPNGFKETFWKMEDTDYGGPLAGGREPHEGADPILFYDTRELKRDTETGETEILDVSKVLDQPVQATKITYRNDKDSAVMTSETYLAPDVDPTKLSYLQTWTRTYWPEGPGLIQVKKDQHKNEQGEMVTVLDVEELWKVSETGVRTLVHTENKLETKE